MIGLLQRRFALSRRGAADLIKGCLACLVLIFVVTRFQYNATYLATYVESGVRRISLAEKLRKIPLSFFGKKDLADLTNSIMGRLCHIGNCIFTLCACAGWFYDFNDLDFSQLICL